MEQNNLYNIRNYLSYLLAGAVLSFYPDAKLATGLSIDNGFYYDFDFPSPISKNDLEKIENKMREILKTWKKFEGKEISGKDAKEFFKNNEYKIELIEEFNKAEETISLYTSGNFTDLRIGGHISDANDIKSGSWKLDRLAGAYWRGDEKNKMLTRIYGLAFESKAELEEYLKNQEEAKKRDHRKLGKELKLFTISDLVGPGLPMLQPKGMILRKEIEDYLWELHKNKGYQRVWTPHLTKKDLYETSGHAAKFGEELFRVKGGDEEFFMKPMNCPHHMQIFADNQFSYRDMPVRYFEPATVYRYEKAGQLAGLIRVRAITQDDGHLFCRVSQITEEVGTIVKIIKEFYTTVNMVKDYWVRLSVRGNDRSKYLGGGDVWEKAENALEKAAKENELNYKRVEGEAAFYGPKLDFMFKDAIGREWQLATIQCDFNLPERFNLGFTNEKGEKEKPVVIHRAISGALERFMALIIEHYAGNFPLWLSPTQVKIIPIRKNHNNYAKEIADELKTIDVRVDLDNSDEGMGKKIHAGKVNKVPYMLVIGDKEIESGELTLEIRDGSKQEKINLENLKIKIQKEIKEKYSFNGII